MSINIRELFPGAADGAYLNTASMALGNSRAVIALERALDEWSHGRFVWAEAEVVGEEVRSLVASLLRTDVENIAQVAGASAGAATVAAQLPRASDPHANIVVPARDYASNFLAWSLLAGRGYELRTVEDVDGELSTDAFASVVDAHTAVVATSLVQSFSGFRVDLDALKEVTRGAGSWLVLDASQALGAIDIDIEGVDALFSCSHKWTLGMRGVAHLYVRPGMLDTFEPITPGWKATAAPMPYYGPSLTLSRTASKLDASTPWFNPLVDVEGLRIIGSVGIRDIEVHNMSLIDELESRGVTIPFKRSNRSSIVSFDVVDSDATIKAFENDNIIASARAGKVRVSMHLYNTVEDVDRLVAAIA
ncbi:MAG: aminotransferase class V-fold PLP-dependent enzyme [Acidimicrobiia bacterium]